MGSHGLVGLRTPAPEPKPVGKYTILVIVLAGVLMSVLDGIVVSIALPTLTRELGVGIGLSQWVMTAYLVTVTSLLLFFGRLSDRTGKSVLFIAGFSLFTLASLACGLSTTLAQLVLFRVAQAVGGAMVFSISGAILFLGFPPAERGRAMGYLGSTVAVGSILGPILGGFLVDTLGWRYIFLINIPIGVVVVVGAVIFLRRMPEERATRLEMDWPGAIALTGIVVTLMLLVSGLEGSTVAVLATVVKAVLLLGFGIFFFLWERRAARPLLRLDLIGTPAFLFPFAAMILFFVANAMISIVGPFYFQGVMRMRPTEVGLILLVVPLIMVVASPVTGWLYDRHPWRYYGTIGIGLVALAFLALGILARGQLGLGGIAAALVGLGLGSSLFQSPNNTEVMNALPRREAAIASSITATGRNLGMTLGIAFGSLLLALQLHGVGVSSTVVDADRGLLARSVGNEMILAAAVAALSVPLLLRRPKDQPPPA